MNVSQHDRACIVANKKSEFPKLTNPVRPLREFLSKNVSKFISL